MSDFEKSVMDQMFDAPSEVYSMDNHDLYGPVAYSMSYRQAVNAGLVTEMKIHLVHVTDADLAEVMESGDIDMNNADGTDEIVLDSDGKKALAIGSVAARKWFEKARKMGIARKALAFFGRKADCRRAIDPNHPLSLVGNDDVKAVEFHSGLSGRARSRAKSEFAAHGGPALMASVRSIREGVSIDDADTAILLRGYGSGEDGTSVELIQHVGRVVRLSPGKEFANVVIPLPGNGTTNEIRERVLRLVRDLLEQMEIMPELIRELENGNGITSGTLNRMNIEIHPSTSVSEDDVAEGVEWTVMEYVKDTNQPLYKQLQDGKIESQLLEDVIFNL